VIAEDMAALHARCFTVPRAFTAAEFAGFLEAPTCFVTHMAGGFALGRVIADEAELLTIAVDPGQRRAGIGRRVLVAFEDTAQARGAATVFLEVAAGNDAARGLYTTAGYCESGRRPAYYRHPDGQKEDAVLMDKALLRA